ncbi:GNAT family N-acetyltransferase [Streptomyces sp. PTM05]|uniref:GNAT family N-acetyltransferase n=1 Tax=Streptantibioticus parmotrematis TaxID=2873249 RepID=A0ABS7QN82_9ACTN|nr:GNAT family N-acetyltransferase [Streptantibioticus parmotrematis]MBY8883244.1 GNAT family N-acetyltransferase [Streptantibioticus parmotrematis]
MHTVRSAGPADASELMRLRRLMFEAMNGHAEHGRWERTGIELIRSMLAAAPGEPSTPRLGAFVVDAGPGAGLAACAVGTVEQRLPAPSHPTGRFGFVFNVCTDPAHRGRGYARATTEALLCWFAEQGVTRVDLHATAEAEGMYRVMGFAEHSTALSLDVSGWAAQPPSPSSTTAPGSAASASPGTSSLPRRLPLPTTT